MTYYFHVAPTCISHTQQICVCQIMCLFGSSRVHTRSFLKVGIKPRNWEGSPASYLLSGEMHLPFLASKWSTDAFTFISPQRRRFFALSIREVRVYFFLQKAVKHSQLFAWLKKNKKSTVQYCRKILFQHLWQSKESLLCTCRRVMGVFTSGCMR